MSEAPSVVDVPGSTLVLADLPGNVAELWSKERRLAATCHIRDKWFGKARGLLGWGGLAPGEAMLLTRCRSVHTIGMRFPIDVIYASKNLEIVGLRERVRAWRSPRGFAGCRHVIEAAAGAIGEWQLAVGDQLELRRAGDEQD